MKVYNAQGQEINLINYTKENQDMPYDAEWTVREESYSDNKIVQWATKSDGKETYKRSFVNGAWSNWLLVEGERLLWEGELNKGQSVTIERLNQFKKFKVYVENVGFMYMSSESDNETYSAIRHLYSSITGYSYLATGIIYVYLTSIKNEKCVRRRIDTMQNVEFNDLKITRIIGIS